MDARSEGETPNLAPSLLSLRRACRTENLDVRLWSASQANRGQARRRTLNQPLPRSVPIVSPSYHMTPTIGTGHSPPSRSDPAFTMTTLTRSRPS